MISLFITFFCMFMPLYLIAQPLQTDVLVYNEGDIQVSSEIDLYQSLAVGVPVTGSILITHDSTQKVDIDSFRMGAKPLKVEFLSSVPMSTNGTLVVSAYKFSLENLLKGQQILPPIIVKVGNQEYQAPALTVDIGEGSD